MAVRTSSSTARNTSYSKPSTPKKPSSASRTNSVSKPSTPTQTKQAVSAPKRDTFTYSSQTAKQTAKKTSTAKTSTASKTTQTKTSTTKTNTAAKTSITKSTTKSKSASTASSKNRDTFTYTSQAAKAAVKSTQNSKVSAQKNTKVSQTKTTVKNNTSNKSTISGALSKNTIKSAKKEVPEGLKLHLKHTTDPKQKAAMQKTMKNIANGTSSEKADKTSKRLKELGVDISKLHFGLNSQVKEAKLVTDAQIFELVADNNSGAEKEGYITQSEYDRILYIITHENGTTENASTDMFATASALLNSFEAQDYYAGYGSMSSKLSTFENNNAEHGLFDANGGSAPEVKELGHQVLDIVIGGVRIDGINCWTGDGSTAFFSSTRDENWRENSAAFKAVLI